MALKIEYETNFGITCDYAHCVIVDTRCNKEIQKEMMAHHLLVASMVTF